MKKTKGLRAGPELQKEPTESDKLRQNIINLCTTIGDRSFVVRQAQADIEAMSVQIEQLRTKLQALEKSANGSEVIK